MSQDAHLQQLQAAIEGGLSLEIDYTNWRGERAWRTIAPKRLYQGESQWHTGQQWLLDADDLDRQDASGRALKRSFAVTDIHRLRPLSDAAR